MYRELKWLVRKCYGQRIIGTKENFLKLEVKQPDKKIILIFLQKPPAEIRRDIRLANFRRSRKCQYWHAYLNKKRIGHVKQIYRRICRGKY